VAGTIFGLICLAHLGRLLLRFHVAIGSHAVPLWLNAVGLIITGLLCAWLWKLSLPAKPAAPSSAA